MTLLAEPATDRERVKAPDHEVVIVGAGFGGMGAAIAFRRLGIDDFVILDRENDLGGTWHVNHYPGLAVDIMSMTYSYSFEPNPYWSRLFAPGEEIKRYAEHVADKYDLRRHMRFGTAVRAARWDERAQLWQVELADGQRLASRYLVAATGYLSQPNLPDIPGIRSFGGKILHTADWDDSYDLSGRRVAVIGTGATAVQLIPKVARVAQHLAVFQRTPIWVAPKLDARVPRQVQELFARFPVTQRAARLAGTSLLELMMVIGVLHFRKGKVFNAAAAKLSLRHLHRQVPDPELRRKLTPDYDFGCKRPTMSNSYYRTFTRPNVSLETDGIERITPSGVVSMDGREIPVDALILATGFNIWDVNFPAFDIVGCAGRNLGKWWRENRFQAYEGISVPGFPNFLNLASPYSYSGLSYFTTIESQMCHIQRLFREVRRRRATVFEVRQEANDAFLRRVTEKLGDSVFYAGSCQTARSYYFNQHGEAAILRPTTTLNAFREAKRFPLDDYRYS